MIGIFDRLARPLLRALDPEDAHRLAIKALKLAPRRRPPADDSRLAARAFGLNLPNPVGIAPGFDKHAEAPDALLGLGFGFVEIGTVTPRPQPGNPAPRLFRLPQAQALINRLGFNSRGVDAFVENLGRARSGSIVGVNIGRNADTPNERALEDYLACLRKVYARASFVTANVSSPNTKNLRELQRADELDGFLAALAAERDRLAGQHGKRVPLAVKISPDLDDAAIAAVADRVAARGIDAVIATNTTVSRHGVEHLPLGGEQGGLSGAPLRVRATEVVGKLRRALPAKVAIIGVGGVGSASDAREKLDAGASLVQLYTALVYRGPGLVGEIVRGLAR